jgi:phosphoglycolate phosphatase
MKFKAIIFDLDGTLLDTLDDLADSMNTVLKGFGFPRHEISAYKYFIGNGIEKLVERALPDSQRDENMLKRATEEMKAVYSRNWAEKTHPYEGILALLDSCVDRGRHGILKWSGVRDHLFPKNRIRRQPLKFQPGLGSHLRIFFIWAIPKWTC